MLRQSAAGGALTSAAASVRAASRAGKTPGRIRGQSWSSTRSIEPAMKASTLACIVRYTPTKPTNMMASAMAICATVSMCLRVMPKQREQEQQIGNVHSRSLVEDQLLREFPGDREVTACILYLSRELRRRHVRDPYVRRRELCLEIQDDRGQRQDSGGQREHLTNVTPGFRARIMTAKWASATATTKSNPSFLVHAANPAAMPASTRKRCPAAALRCETRGVRASPDRRDERRLRLLTVRVQHEKRVAQKHQPGGVGVGATAQRGTAATSTRASRP